MINLVSLILHVKIYVYDVCVCVCIRVYMCART